MVLERPPEQNGRKYRSKKQRPCDLCRSRKIQCKMQQGNEGPCDSCKRLDRRCTFVLEPLRKKRQTRHLSSDNASPTQLSGHDNSQMDVDPASLWLPSTQGVQLSWDPIAFHFDGDLGHPQHTAETRPEPGEYLSNSFYQLDTPWPHNGVFHISGPSDVGGLPDNTTLPDNQPFPSNRQDVVDVSPDSSDSTSLPLETSDWLAELSLDTRRGYSCELIGLSSESDPYLLRHYEYNMHDTYTMFRLDFRKVVDDRSALQGTNVRDSQPRLCKGDMPVQFVMSNEEIYKDGLESVEKLFSGQSTEMRDLEILNGLVSADLGSRLLKLYSRFVHPRFPALSLADLEAMKNRVLRPPTPVGLRSAVYALAAPFAFLDDDLSVSRGYRQVSTDELWAIAYRSFQRSCQISHLASLQLCLLLLHMPPPNVAVGDPPGFWALSCSAVALSESLGLNLDPSEWRLPRKERMLRSRLWWLMHTLHTWQALVLGRPSHINDANWDVAELTSDDFEGDEHGDPEVRHLMVEGIPLCLAECRLGIIAADVLKEFYTLKANRQSLSLGVLLNRAQPLRARIDTWRQTLPLLSKLVSDLDCEDLEKGASLRVSHLTVEILIFRALLRPLLYHTVPTADPSSEPISTILGNCYTCAKVGTEIVSSLGPRNFSTFWPPYVRYQLCYLSTFILLDLAQSPTTESAIRNNTLLRRWRDTLRTQSRAWPLLRLATIRLDAVFRKGLSAAVHGTGPDSPAAVLLRAG